MRVVDGLQLVADLEDRHASPVISNDVQPATRDLLIEQARETLLHLEEDLKDVAHSAPQYAVSAVLCWHDRDRTPGRDVHTTRATRRLIDDM
jgi:hypothetical protein